MIAGWIYIFVIVGAIAAAAFVGTGLLLRRQPLELAGGAVFIVIAGFLPLLLYYVFPIGMAAAVAGAIAAGVRSRRTLARSGIALVAAAVLVLAAEVPVTLVVYQVQSDETYDRCVADQAVAAIEKSRLAGQGYPADMRGVAAFDGEYGDPCYVNSSVNWLYHVAAPGTYTLGYWVDWHFARHVCLHSARTQGWSCGFEAWGPFKPGEVDR